MSTQKDITNINLLARDTLASLWGIGEKKGKMKKCWNCKDNIFVQSCELNKYNSSNSFLCDACNFEMIKKNRRK